MPSFNCRYYSTQTIYFPYAAADHTAVFQPNVFYVDNVVDIEETY